MSNLEIGKRIRTLRTEKGLSREAFCGDEKHLTVRQLARIETGNNLPSLAKLDYIAEVLGVPMSQLIDEGMIIVPKEYLKLKTKLIRQSIHGDEEKVHQREAIFEDIQEHFYDKLPEDEQVAVEVLQAIDDVYVSENVEFGEGLIEEYFNQTLLQTEYSVNDLLILYLYFLSPLLFYGFFSINPVMYLLFLIFFHKFHTSNLNFHILLFHFQFSATLPLLSVRRGI